MKKQSFLLKSTTKSFDSNFLDIFHLYFSSCVDESQLCKGTPLCANKQDLKWCKNSTKWSIDPGPLDDHYKCTSRHSSNETNSNGQWIKDVEREDRRIFHCLNRGDENPFSETKRKNATEEKSKETWMELVNMPCDDGKKYRRCLGNRPDQCVFANSKF